MNILMLTLLSCTVSKDPQPIKHQTHSQNPNKEVKEMPIENFLPRTKSRGILRALEEAYQRLGPDLSHGKSLTFESAESSFYSQKPIINRIALYETHDYSVWLMRQKQDSWESDKPEEWSLFAIIIDTKARPKKAYYLEFMPDKTRDRSGKLPQTIMPNVPCLTCHANGPRAPRPKESQLVPTLNTDQFALLEKWNKKISNSGPIESFEPTAGMLTARNQKATDDTDLGLKVCTDCHDPQSGIRSKLQRRHLQSILFLISSGKDNAGYTTKTSPSVHAFMPLDDEPLSGNDRFCLHNWLENSPLPKYCYPSETAKNHQNITTSLTEAEAVNKLINAAKAPSESSKLWAVGQTDLFLRLKSSVGTFDITKIGVQGNLEIRTTRAKGVANDLCVGDLTVNLQDSTTEIRVRDLHMKKLLTAGGWENLAKASFEISPCGVGYQKSKIQFPASIEFRGKRRKIEVSAVCQLSEAGQPKGGKKIACDQIAAKLDLRDFEIPKPKFLHLEVDSQIMIQGKITFSPEEKAAVPGISIK